MSSATAGVSAVVAVAGVRRRSGASSVHSALISSSP
jgi:hypothetical protein